MSAPSHSTAPTLGFPTDSGAEPFQLLDILAFGVVMLDPQRKVLHASRAASHALHHGSALRLSDGILEAACAHDTNLLQGAVNRSQRGERAFITVGSHDASMEIAVLPTHPHPGPGRALVVLENTSQANQLTLHYFAVQHGLTRAEQRLLSVLRSGASVKEAAEEIGCTANTARTHIRHLLEKTEQANLRALISRLARLPPLRVE